MDIKFDCCSQVSGERQTGNLIIVGTCPEIISPGGCHHDAAVILTVFLATQPELRL